MNHIQPLAKLVVALALVSGFAPTRAGAWDSTGQDQDSAHIVIPDQAQPIMGLKEVRVGMKGYGLTVFAGTKIEPFPVEVLSIVPDAGPKRGIIWILCTDERLIKSGPVQGMSGSPIYLWDQDQDQEPGQGGRLIGAFAFGFSDPKDCLAGVQPIELMRAVGSRVASPTDDATVAGGTTGGTAGGTTGGGGVRGLRLLQQLAAEQLFADASPIHRFRLEAVLRMLGRSQRANGKSPQPGSGLGPNLADLSRYHDQQALPMLLTMSIPTPGVANAVRPLLRTLGIAAVGGGGGSGGGTMAGSPPPSIDIDQARLQPGSVLSVPMAYGDLDLAGVGTCTDVLPDGTVLGFGHAMFGQGPVAIPMATGYVHFFVARSSVSFKVSGTLQIAGSILQDESSAVAGNMARRFKTAPLKVSVTMPGQEQRDYHYQIIDHPELTPIISAICTLESVQAVQSLPIENTMRVQSSMRFTGGRTLRLNTVLPAASAMDLIWELLPAIGSMMSNPFEQLKLEAMDITINVEPQILSATLLNARIDQARVKPGEKIGITLTLQPYRQAAQTLRREFTIPADTPEGDYQLMLMDAWSYGAMMMSSRPYLFHIENVDQLHETLATMMSVRSDAMYAVLQLPQQDIAVGRQPLVKLPSSRRALILTPTDSAAITYTKMVEQMITTNLVVSGQQSFPVQVRKANSTLP